MIGKDQAAAGGKQRGAGSRATGLVDLQKAGADQKIAVAGVEKVVALAGRERTLQQKQVDCQSQRVAAGKALRAIGR
jgi:hypothetical protein